MILFRENMTSIRDRENPVVVLESTSKLFSNSHKIIAEKNCC